MAKPLIIVKYPDPILRRNSKPVVKFNSELQRLIDAMVLTMRKAEGIGLAAPQIGKSLQLIVIEFTPDPDEKENIEPIPLTVLINPKIIVSSDVLVEMEEGCLSVPGRDINIIRPESVSIENTKPNGEKYTFDCSGLLARVCQHEMDHLQGKLIIDYPDTNPSTEPTTIL